MAESSGEEVINNSFTSRENDSIIECAVCLQTSVHPAELPCGHIFCYLCIKGIVNQGRRCAMCRQDIPIDYLNKPRLLKPVVADNTNEGFEDGHLWFYEGHNGWWQYDERSSLELECAYQVREQFCDLLIAGFLYVIDFDDMVQYRKNDPSRRRRIKRDLATTTKKGIAGLKATMNSTSSEVVSHEIIQNLPASNTSALNNLSDIRIFSSASNNFGQIIEPSTQSSYRLPESSSRCSLSSCRPANPSDSNASPLADDSASYSRNLNLDTVIHDTLDWTIEQIESLNLELLNDYEALFRDVNNYGELQNNLNQRRCGNSNNYMSRYLNTSNPLSESFENDSNSSHRASDLSNLTNGVINNSSLVSSASLEETNFMISEVTETSPNRSLQPESGGSSSPLPPPRSRVFRARLTRGSSQNSPNANTETLLQKLIFNKK